MADKYLSAAEKRLIKRVGLSWQWAAGHGNSLENLIRKGLVEHTTRKMFKRCKPSNVYRLTALGYTVQQALFGQ